MAKFFINRPVFAIVLSLIITILGVVSALNLPIAQYPQISPPTVSISTAYVGANADVVDQTVAQAIEQQVNGVEGMAYMTSTSTDAGSYSLSIQFESGKNADMASVQAQNRASEATPSLPSSVQTTGVSTRKATSEMALVFTLFSEDDRFSTNFLTNYGTVYLIDDIKRVKGVGDVMAFGSDYSMRVWLQPEKMANLGLSASEVTAAIAAQNKQAAAGSFGKLPSDSNQEFQYTASVKGRLTSVEEFENIIVRSKADGAITRLKDVARVEFAAKDYSYTSSMDGHGSTGFAIQLTNDANALETIGEVKKVLAESSKSFPEGLEYRVIVDNTKFVRESMIEVAKTFAEALLLVIVVVFLFLQSWRATLIPVLAIPVSLIGTFGAFSLLGFTINTLTMFAMVLAIGLVVDDAIVVVEAVEHHMRYSGLSPKEATVRAMNEVSGPVVAIAFVLAAVFIPVAFFGGMMGVLYKQFALTIAVSMALSAVVALSLTPALCTLLLKHYDAEAHGGVLGRFFSAFNNWFEALIEKYGFGLGHVIYKARTAMLGLLILVVLTGVLFAKVPSSFVPDEDQGYYITAVSLPEASSLNRTDKALRSFSEMVRQQPGVDGAMAIAGFDLLGGGTKPNTGVLFVSLNPWDERKSPQTQVKAEIGQTFGAGMHFPEATAIAFSPPALPGLGMVGGFTLMLQDRSGGGLDELDTVAQQFVAAAQQRPEIGSVVSNFKNDTPRYEFEVDREKAEQLGVGVDDVFTALQTYVGSVQVNDINKFGRTYKVTVQAESQFRDTVEGLRSLYVKSSSGTMVPLNTLIKTKRTNAPTVITRYNGAKAVKISGNPAAGYSSGQAMTALEEVAKEVLPAGYTYDWSGQSREEKQSGNRAPIVFGMAILFVFLCLAALYESWSVPFAVLLAVPSGLFGAFLFQYVRGLENSVYMQIGLVMLIGLAAKNAILIVEFAKVRVDNGMDVIAATLEASKIRLRPIIMTSLAFIIGCLPLMIATGAGAGARNAMGTAVVGGMLLATMLGIFLIPVLFVVVEKVTKKLSK